MDQVKRVEEQRNGNQRVEVVLYQKQETKFWSSFWIHREFVHSKAEQLRTIDEHDDNREIQEHYEDVETYVKTEVALV